MSVRPQIPGIEGVQDKQIAGILGPMKMILESITGRLPNRQQIAALGANAGLAALTNKVNEIIARLQSNDTGAAAAAVSGTGILTNALTADVNLTNTALYFDGPSVAQGRSGTWLVLGTVTVTDTNAGGGNISVKLWDGTKTIGSTYFPIIGSGSVSVATFPVSGIAISPSGNLRISVNNPNNTVNSAIKFNQSGNGMDSSITAIRIA